MNDKASLKDVWQAFLAHLKKPKTIWDIKDYSFGCLVVFGPLILLTWLASCLN